MFTIVEMRKIEPEICEPVVVSIGKVVYGSTKHGLCINICSEKVIVLVEPTRIKVGNIFS